MGNKPKKRNKNSIHGCMGRKCKRGKIVPYFTNRNEKKKKFKGSAKFWYLLGSNYKSSCTNLYFLCKIYVATVNLFLSSPRRFERRPAFLHRLSPRLTRLPGLVPQSDPWGVRFSYRHSPCLTQAAHVKLDLRPRIPCCSVELCFSLPVRPWIQRWGPPSRQCGPYGRCSYCER